MRAIAATARREARAIRFHRTRVRAAIDRRVVKRHRALARRQYRAVAAPAESICRPGTTAATIHTATAASDSAAITGTIHSTTRSTAALAATGTAGAGTARGTTAAPRSAADALGRAGKGGCGW